MSCLLKTKKNTIIILSTICLVILFFISLFTGKYPLDISSILSGDELQLRVFITLRLSRTILSVLGGFVLGIAGYVFQTVFRNPLASPDMIGVASGASVGAAVGILLFSGGLLVTCSSFIGAIVSVLLTLFISSLDINKNTNTIVLAGIGIHAIDQTILMVLKLIADPQNELAAIEYWMMGSLSGTRMDSIFANLIISVICVIILVLLHRQTLLLSLDEAEAKSLGVNVSKMYVLVLGIATLAVACVISLTGLISFIGIIAPHFAKRIIKKNSISTVILCGLLGACFLCCSDILARCIGKAELPISIFTSLIGAPFLIYIILRRT